MRGIDLESAWTPWEDVGDGRPQGRRRLRRGRPGHLAGGLEGLLQGIDRRARALAGDGGGVQTVQTLAMQVWLKPDLDGARLGAVDDPLGLRPAVRHLVRHDAGPRPRDLARRAEAGQHLVFLRPDEGPRDPPRARRPRLPRPREGLRQADVDRLPDPLRRPPLGRLDRPARPRPVPTGPSWKPPTRSPGVTRFDSQYWRANVNPTDRYVISLPGTTSSASRPTSRASRTSSWPATGSAPA